MSSILHKNEPPTGLLLFSWTYRAQVQDALKLCGKSSNAKQVTRVLISRWKLLTDFQQLVWNTHAKGFILFTYNYRSQVKAALQLCGKSSDSKYVIFHLVKYWKRLSYLERHQWNSKAIHVRFIRKTKLLSD